MKRYIPILVSFIVVAAIACAIPIWSYFHHFSNIKSDDQQVWGTFGDFMGGTLNPIIALLNLAALVILSYFVAKSDDTRHKNQYLHIAYNALVDYLSSINMENPPKGEGILFLLKFYERNSFLIDDDLNDQFSDLMDKVHNSSVMLQHSSKYAKKIPIDLEKRVDKLHFNNTYLLGENRRLIQSCWYDLFLIDKSNILKFVQANLLQKRFEISKHQIDKRLKCKTLLDKSEEKRIKYEADFKDTLKEIKETIEAQKRAKSLIEVIKTQSAKIHDRNRL